MKTARPPVRSWSDEIARAAASGWRRCSVVTIGASVARFVSIAATVSDTTISWYAIGESPTLDDVVAELLRKAHLGAEGIEIGAPERDRAELHRHATVPTRPPSTKITLPVV